MAKWRCSVCGYGHRDNASPRQCPVCGADGSRFVSAAADDDGAPSPESPIPNAMISASQNWQCGVCGYISTGPEPPEVCPVCGAQRTRFASIAPPSEPYEAGHAAPSADAVEAPRWRCSVCGYGHTGSEPPVNCPVCGAQRAKFAHLEETLQKVEPAVPEPRSVDPSANQPTTSQWQAVAASIAPHRRWIDLSIDHHAHPIAVHIPNGVLPITVLMVLSAAVFDWPAIGQAAIYNLGFICLAMPLVLFTGFVHWQFKFGGHMTDLFKWKLICGATVLLLSLVLFIWSLFSPESARNPGALYLLLHLILLVAAGVAGWLGGKLVFRPRD
jgi:rubrerythrin/uncharacterized membrane protein